MCFSSTLVFSIALGKIVKLASGFQSVTKMLLVNKINFWKLWSTRE